jgi:lactate 2-monooxygenase
MSNPQPVTALERQKEIFIKGISGRRPLVPVDPRQLEKQALAKKQGLFTYISGGAGVGDTMEGNRTGLRQWRILPRMLRDVSTFDTSVVLFGRRLPAPLLLCPIGVLEMAHPDADLAVARAAAALGLPMIFSNQASVPMEECAAAMGDSPRWFQLYWSKSRELVQSFLQRAEACGCEAIVLTLDTNLLGWRVEDLDRADLPFLRGLGIAQYSSDPVFQRMIEEPDEENLAETPRRLNWDALSAVLQLMRRYPGGFFENLRTQKPLKAVRKFINTFSNPALQWEDLPFLRENTRLPILLKGILHPDDARRALDYGIDGLIVSNHGGRQIDGAVSAIEALPEVVEAVEGKIPVLMDSGIRSGSDIFKALALGARAVCIGRPYVFGLALAGEAGVREVLMNTMADFEVTMRLAGRRKVGEIGGEAIKLFGH